MKRVCVFAGSATGQRPEYADAARDPGPAMAAADNKRNRQTWDDIRRFLAIHYKFNARLDTPFWRAARSDIDLAGAEEFIEFFEENGPSVVVLSTRLAMFAPTHLS